MKQTWMLALSASLALAHVACFSGDIGPGDDDVDGDSSAFQYSRGHSGTAGSGWTTSASSTTGGGWTTSASSTTSGGGTTTSSTTGSSGTTTSTTSGGGTTTSTTTSGGGTTSTTTGGGGTTTSTTTSGGGTTTSTTTSGGSSSDPAQLCVDSINAYRQTLGLPAYARWTDAEVCSNSEAQQDSQSGQAHGAFGQCSEWAQNECPGWGGPPEKMITGCLKMMWDEGPGEFNQGHGHYINMSSTSYTKVSCGFHVLPNGNVWAVQNFK